MKRQLESSGAKYVITTPAFVSALKAARNGCSTLSSLTIIVIGEQDDESCISFFELVKTDPSGLKFLMGSKIDTRKEVALLPYSSGTTGLPKGVMLTHENVCTNILQVTEPGVLMMKKMEEQTMNTERLIGVVCAISFSLPSLCLFST
jgi:long-subunit acyl-CoA synthetase (AMP-forming)